MKLEQQEHSLMQILLETKIAHLQRCKQTFVLRAAQK